MDTLVTPPAAPRSSTASTFTERISNRFRLSPINRRRWENFKRNRRGYW